MLRLRSLLPMLLFLPACSEAPTAPLPADSSSPMFATAAKQQGAVISCVASRTTSGYTVTITWKRARVLNVLVTTETGTLTESFRRVRRKGSITFTPSDEPLGFRLDDGEQVVAQGGCAAP